MCVKNPLDFNLKSCPCVKMFLFFFQIPRGSYFCWSNLQGFPATEGVVSGASQGTLLDHEADRELDLMMMLT